MGLLTTSLSLLGSMLLGFGGFSINTFCDYLIVGNISRFQMIFLFLTALGLILSGLGYADQTKTPKSKNSKSILIAHVAVSLIFVTLAIFGLTAELKGVDFWADTTFKEAQHTLLFNNVTLTSFFAIGILQIFVTITLSKTERPPEHQLSKSSKILILGSGMFWIVKAIIDYPPIKEIIFIFSYTYQFHFLNNILTLIALLTYLSAQIFIITILLHNKKS